MKAVSRLLALLLPTALLLPPAAYAQAPVMPPAPALKARAYVLYDFSSNQILVSQGGHQHLPPAELTKLMTAYVVLTAVKEQQFDLTQTAYPSLDAIRPQHDEARMFLDHNKAVTVDDLLHGLIVGSGDDAVRVLVDLMSGNEEEFAALMNRQAQTLGMHDTHFTNATGKPDAQQYSSAYDLALLSAAMLRDFPKYYALYGQRQYIYKSITLFNNNRLLWNDPHVDGIKIGGDRRTGYALALSGERENRRLIAVVLGSPSDAMRYSEGEALLNFGFRNFDAWPLYHQNQAVGSLRIWKGAARKVKVGFPNGLSVTVPKRLKPVFKATLEAPDPVMAPIAAGQPLAVLKLSLNGKPYAEFPVFALESVQPANVFSRGLDTIRLMFQ